MKNKCTKFQNYRQYTAKPLGTWKMFDNPTDNHTDIEVPLYDKLRFHEAKNELVKRIPGSISVWFPNASEANLKDMVRVIQC